MKITRIVPCFALFLAVQLPAQESRPLKVDDIFALKSVGDPQVSPEGKWVAYTVSAMDAKEDSSDTDIYMAPFSGGTPLRLTGSKKAETSPRWSPDGRYLAFLSAREGNKTQVWLLDRTGGEAFKLTDSKSGVSSLAWSPDGKRLALVISDVDPDQPPAEAEEAKPKTPKPLVIRRLQFKQDGIGYLKELYRHVYIFDLDKKTSEQITTGPYDDRDPAWSPDGRWIAYETRLDRKSVV